MNNEFLEWLTFLSSYTSKKNDKRLDELRKKRENRLVYRNSQILVYHDRRLQENTNSNIDNLLEPLLPQQVIFHKLGEQITGSSAGYSDKTWLAVFGRKSANANSDNLNYDSSKRFYADIFFTLDSIILGTYQDKYNLAYNQNSLANDIIGLSRYYRSNDRDKLLAPFIGLSEDAYIQEIQRWTLGFIVDRNFREKIDNLFALGLINLFDERIETDNVFLVEGLIYIREIARKFMEFEYPLNVFIREDMDKHDKLYALRPNITIREQYTTFECSIVKGYLAVADFNLFSDYEITNVIAYTYADSEDAYQQQVITQTSSDDTSYGKTSRETKATNTNEGYSTTKQTSIDGVSEGQTTNEDNAETTDTGYASTIQDQTNSNSEGSSVKEVDTKTDDYSYIAQTQDASDSNVEGQTVKTARAETQDIGSATITQDKADSDAKGMTVSEKTAETQNIGYAAKKQALTDSSSKGSFSCVTLILMVYQENKKYE